VSFSATTCPHCSIEIRINELPHEGLFESYRLCPGCGGQFTVDKNTKYRQAALIVIALISLALTILLYFGESRWLVPAVISYAVLGLLIYWGNKKVYFVPYEGGQDSSSGG